MGYKSHRPLKYINFAISFGLTLAITLYILYQAGYWLDRRLGTSPVFMFLGVLLAVIVVFKRLVVDLLKEMDKERDS